MPRDRPKPTHPVELPKGAGLLSHRVVKTAAPGNIAVRDAYVRRLTAVAGKPLQAQPARTLSFPRGQVNARTPQYFPLEPDAPKRTTKKIGIPNDPAAKMLIDGLQRFAEERERAANSKSRFRK